MEECRTAMLHVDMTLARLMVYVQSIEESKHRRMARSFKRRDASDQELTRLKKNAQIQEEPKRFNVKLTKGGGSNNGKPTCVTCGKKQYCECLLGTGSCNGCGKEQNMVRYCPMIYSRGRESKKVAPSAQIDDAPTKRCFYVLRTRGAMTDENGDDGEVKSLPFLFKDMSSL